jgi:hypothetical protein
MRDGYVVGETGPRVIAEAEAIAAASAARDLVAAR